MPHHRISWIKNTGEWCDELTVEWDGSRYLGTVRRYRVAPVRVRQIDAEPPLEVSRHLGKGEALPVAERPAGRFLWAVMDRFATELFEQWTKGEFTEDLEDQVTE